MDNSDKFDFEFEFEILDRLEDIDRVELLLIGEWGLLDELLLDFLLRKIEEKAEVMEFFVARLASLPAKKMKTLPDFCRYVCCFTYRVSHSEL